MVHSVCSPLYISIALFHTLCAVPFLHNWSNSIKKNVGQSFCRVRVAEALGSVLEFVMEVGNRKNPWRYGFFVELDRELGGFTFYLSNFRFSFRLHPQDNSQLPLHWPWLQKMGWYWQDWDAYCLPSHLRDIPRISWMADGGNGKSNGTSESPHQHPATKEWLAAKVILEVGNL